MNLIILLVHDIHKLSFKSSPFFKHFLCDCEKKKTQYAHKGFGKMFHLVWQLPQIIQESPVYRVMKFSTSFILVSEDIPACLESNRSRHWNEVLPDEFC